MCVHRSWHELNDLGIEWPEKLWSAWVKVYSCDLDAAICLPFLAAFASDRDEDEFAQCVRLMIVSAHPEEREDLPGYSPGETFTRTTYAKQTAETRALP